MVDASLLVFQLVHAHVVIEHRFEFMAAAAGAAVIQLPNHETLVREHLVPGQPLPHVMDGLDAGTAINHHDGRILLRRIETGGFDEPRIEQRAVHRLHGDDLGGEDFVFFGVW